MSVGLVMNIEEAKSILSGLPGAEYNIQIAGKDSNEGKVKSEDLKELCLSDESRKINLDLANLSALRFLCADVFRCQSSLLSVSLPDSLEVIGNFAFASCDNLACAEIKSVKVIGNYAFLGCTSLSELRFSGTKAQWNDVVKGEKWSAGVSALCVQCSDGEVPIETMYFDDEKNLVAVHPKATSIELPADCNGVQNLYVLDKSHYPAMDIGNSAVSEIKVSADNEHFVSYDGVLYSKSDKKLYFCPPKKSGVLVVPKDYSIYFSEQKGYKRDDYITVGVSFANRSSCGDITEIRFEDSRKTIGFPAGFDKIRLNNGREIPVSFG